MREHPRTGQPHGLILWVRPTLYLLLAVLGTAASSGCTRHFFRKSADKEVTEVLVDKDKYPQWHIEQFHVYPDPRARFADPTCPDHPPMPPDDPAAWDLSPHAQRPGKVGVATVGGTGYLDLLTAWGAENRRQAEEEEKKAQAKESDPKDSAAGTSRSKAWQKETGPKASPKETPKDEAAPSEPAPAESPEPAKQAEGGSPAAPGTPCAFVDRLQQPFHLKLEQAVELGLINSREFQDRREDLYLAALPVTAERFAFAFQFLAFEQAIRERIGSEHPAAGPEGNNRWRFDTGTGFSKLFSTGALLLFGFANRTVVELTGQQTHTVSESTLNLDLVQPLLQGGGRVVTLEPLTQGERNLLYELRSYARFRKDFFVNIVGGTGLGHEFDVPARLRGSRPGLVISGVAGIGPVVVPGGSGGVGVAISALFTPQDGYLPTLLRQALLANDRENVQSLEKFLTLYRAFQEGGDVSVLQVNRIEQQLLQSRSSVLQRELDFRDSLDRFKQQLGLPTNLPLELDEEPLRQIDQQLLRFDAIINEYDSTRTEAGRLNAVELAPEIRARLRRLFTASPLVRGTRFSVQFPARWARWERLSDNELTVRLKQLGAEHRQLLNAQDQLKDVGQDLTPEQLQRLNELEFELVLGTFEQLLRRYEAQPWKQAESPEQRDRQHSSLFRDLLNLFELVLSEARNERFDDIRNRWPELPSLTVDGVDLLKAELEQAQTVVAQTALTNRFDLMNARAQLVDAWRQIAISANSLLGVFNVRYHMDSTTPGGQAQPFAFTGSRTRHQLILDGELPLVRKVERNIYRATLIAYQRQRRALMAAEDQVLFEVRSQIRQLRTLAENYKIQRQATELAYVQVEQSLESFLQPPTPTTGPPGSGSAAGNAAALTQQLLEAQQRLNSAQNQLYSVWINYHTTRLELYRDLELMPLDYRGVWIDEPAACNPRDIGARGTTDTGSGPGDQRPSRGGEGAPRPERLPQPQPVPSPPGAQAEPPA